MTTDWKALCVDLVDELEDWIAYGDVLAIEKAHNLVDRARTLLAQPELPELTDEELISAHDLAAGWNQQADDYNQWDSLDLYEQLAWAQARAIAADRARALLAQPEPEEPSDDKLMYIARATDLVYYMGEGRGFASPYMEEADITAEVLAYAREVLARHGGSTFHSTKA